jgi:uncharacterized protein GlcG (DUF336 family)
MTDTVPHLRLTISGAFKVLHAAIAKAEAMNVPQCITVVDDGGHILAFARMDGGRVMSIDSSNAKARTAAASRVPTGKFEDPLGIKLAMTAQGRYVNLPGGLPIVVDGHVIGAIGVGSGTGEQDIEVAKAGIAALAGAKAW